MLRLDNDSQEQPSLWESVLPPELFQMNEELTQVDKLLSDERFLTPFQQKFGTGMGRPTTAVATYYCSHNNVDLLICSISGFWQPEERTHEGRQFL